MCTREAAVYSRCVECASLLWVEMVLENDRDTLSEAEVERLEERLAEEGSR